MKESLISWSPLAEETYLKTLSQIFDRWTIKEAESFEAKVESLIEKLKTQKRLCLKRFNYWTTSKKVQLKTSFPLISLKWILNKSLHKKARLSYQAPYYLLSPVVKNYLLKPTKLQTSPSSLGHTTASWVNTYIKKSPIAHICT